jgi:hypothetical protein
MIPFKGIPPLCQVPGCQQGAQIYSKVGDNTQYLKTCYRHWADLIPQNRQQKDKYKFEIYCRTQDYTRDQDNNKKGSRK